jgi:N-acetylneuraminic acid mutarotase
LTARISFYLLYRVSFERKLSTVNNFLDKRRLAKTIPTILTITLLIILSSDTSIYSANATPTGGFWTTEAPRLGPAQEGLGAATVGKIVFAIGGNAFGGGSCRNDAYDPTTNSWTSRTPTPTCIVEPAGVVSVAGLVYLISGICRGFTTVPCVSDTETSALQIYNPTTDTWSIGAPILTPRSRAGVAVYNGKIFVIGGYLGLLGTQLNVVEAYDVVTNTWTTAAPMPTAREGLMAATVGNKIFAIGGFTIGRLAASATGIVEAYNIVTNTWTAAGPANGLATMTTPRGTVNTMGGVACGNEPIFVIGGMTTSGAPTNVNEAYVPSLNEWITRPTMPTARGEGGTGIVGSRLFVIGGGMPPEISTILDTNVNEAYQCSNTIAGKVTSGGLGVGGLTVSVSGVSGLIGTALTAVDGFYSIDLPAGGTYAVSATTLTGTVTTTVNLPTGTITIQNLSS